MSDNQIVLSKENVVALSANGGITEMIKPLMQEIFLISTFVAGTTYIKDKSVFDEIKVGDKLNLVREPENKYDEFAIAVFTQSGKKLGYLPEKDNPILARLLDAGKRLAATVEELSVKGNYVNIRIKISLVDF